MQLKVLQKIQDILDKISKENNCSNKDPIADDQRDLGEEPNSPNKDQSLQSDSSQAVMLHIQSLIEAQRSKIEQAQKGAKAKPQKQADASVPVIESDQPAHDLKAIKQRIGKRTHAGDHDNAPNTDKNGQ